MHSLPSHNLFPFCRTKATHLKRKKEIRRAPSRSCHKSWLLIKALQRRFLRHYNSWKIKLRSMTGAGKKKYNVSATCHSCHRVEDSFSRSFSRTSRYIAKNIGTEREFERSVILIVHSLALAHRLDPNGDLQLPGMSTPAKNTGAKPITNHPPSRTGIEQAATKLRRNG